MNKKILDIFVSLLMLLICIGPTVFLENNSTIKATTIALGNVGLDYDTIYGDLQLLSDLIFDPSLAEAENGIYKGRDFGTAGDRQAADQIEIWMEQFSSNLTGSAIYKEPIGYFNSLADNYIPRKIDIEGFQLQFKNGENNPITIPNNESFPIVPGWKLLTNKNIDFTDVIIYTDEMDNNPESDECDYQKFNVSFKEIQDRENFSDIGLDDEIVYIENYSNISTEEIEGRVHLLLNISNNDLNETLNLIADANATGYLLVNDNPSDLQDWQLPLPGVAISEENGSLIRGYIQNQSVNNVSVLLSTFPVPLQGEIEIYFYNNSCPCHDNIILLINQSKEPYWKNLTKKWLHKKYVVGSIYYNGSTESDSLTHLAKVSNVIESQWFFKGCQGFRLGMWQQLNSYGSRWIYPVTRFYINRSIFFENGDSTYIDTWVNNNDIKASFSINWTKNPYVNSYNVYCTVPGKDTGKTVIISGGHYDGFWGQMATDDASGVAVMLGILKYMNDHHITPKCNLVFITFSGEEYIDKGSRGYVLRHWDEINEDTIECIINLDTLAHDTDDSTLTITSLDRLQPIKRVLINNIVSNISEWTDYESINPSYNLETIIACNRLDGSIPGTDVFPFWLRNITGINFGKEPYDQTRHRTGTNHNRGDTMTHIDRRDLNSSSDLVWNISKYFSVDPDCWFDDISYNIWDSTDNNDLDDSVNITFSVNTSLPQDRIWVKAILISQDYPILCRYKAQQYYVVTPVGLQDTLTVTLPDRAPQGNYILKVYLYNSTGIVDRNLITITDYLDFGYYANEKYEPSEDFFLYPPNDPPETPHQPWGNESVLSKNPYEYTTHTTDPNGDSIWYQWKIETNLGLGRFTLYTRWIFGGPKTSGENISKNIQWPFAGTYNVSVRAKDNILNPNVMSEWSPAKQVTVTQSDNAAPWNTDLLGAFSSSMVAINQQTSCNGFATGIIMENSQKASLNWTWDFGDSSIAYGENVSHSYSRKGNYDVNLMLKNPEGRTSNYTTVISVDVLRADFTTIGDEQPNETVYFTDSSSGISSLVNWSWDFGDGNHSFEQNTSHVFAETDDYNVTLTVQDSEDNSHEYSQHVYIESVAPDFISVLDDPDPVGYGNNVTIYVDFFDNQSRVESVMINITYPDNTTSGNFTMEQNMSSEHDYLYVFNDTWQKGVYNYSIFVVDFANNTNSTSGFNFTVSAEAMISIATLQDNYSGSQYINITDPPNPLENYTLVDRGSTWDLYYDAVTGENILEVSAGAINYQENGIWTPINNTLSQLVENHPAYVYGYRSGNNRGLYGAYFKSNAQQEWPVAFTYNNSDDPTIHAVRSKLVGVGYVDPQSNWAYQYLQSVQSSQGQTNDYSITYPGVFTGTDVTWSYGNSGLKEEITLSNATKNVLQSHPPSQYGLNDASSYLVFITRLDYQNLNLCNSSGVLNGNVTVSDTGLDLKDALGQFKCALPLGEVYELNNRSAQQNLIYRIIHLNGNTYLLSGLKVADLNTMTFPVVIDPTLSVNSHHNDAFISSSSTSYNTAWGATSGTVDSSSTYLTIGQKKAGFPISTYYIYRGYVLFDTTALPSNAYLDSAILSLYKKDDYSTTDFAITIQNGQPTYPHNPLQTGDYDKGYYSGNGGSLNTAYFVNGRNNITVTELGWINETGWTKFCLRSSRDISGTAPTGNEYVNVYSTDAPLQSYVPKLIITYRNQSKIKNTGSTDIKGYLLIQIQFYNTTQGKWLVDNDTVNETTARTITSGNQLALDTIFNGHVRASDLINGAGTYRVYAAFRDPDGNVLRTNDDMDLEAWWQFSKT